MVTSLKDNSDLFSPENCPLLVIKIGSSLLIEDEGAIRQNWLETLITDISARQFAGQKIIIVSSGAVALGARKLNMAKGGRASLSDAQAAASVGQIMLSGAWSDLLENQNIVAAQMLVTLNDLEDRRGYLNIASTLRRLLKADVIPIVNENDSVRTEEIRFGDNDRLAARVAQSVAAAGVILLSDVDGLFDRDPSKDGAQIIPYVADVDDNIRMLVSGSSASDMGSGGMGSKLEAAEIAGYAGIRLALISGLYDNPLDRFAQGGPSTVFDAHESQGSHKNWLAGRLTTEGRIFIDAGALRAIDDGGSLLPAGAQGVEGSFSRGDVLDIIHDGKSIAKGVSEYDVDDAIKICGKQSDELPIILGSVPRRTMVHRDHLVMLP